MIETTFVTLLLVAGLFFIVFRPISRLTLGPGYWDVGVGTATVIIFVIYIMSAYVTPAMIEDDLAKEPCGSNTPQGSCYSLDRKLCENIWAKFSAECRNDLADMIKARPTGLMGPALNRCSARKMDKAVHFNRVQGDTAYCKAYFKYIEEKF